MRGYLVYDTEKQRADLKLLAGLFAMDLVLMVIAIAFDELLIPALFSVFEAALILFDCAYSLHVLRGLPEVPEDSPVVTVRYCHMFDSEYRSRFGDGDVHVFEEIEEDEPGDEARLRPRAGAGRREHGGRPSGARGPGRSRTEPACLSFK